jgi:hypothetical protein
VEHCVLGLEMPSVSHHPLVLVAVALHDVLGGRPLCSLTRRLSSVTGSH